jgi:hypothetical protein
VCPDNGRLIAYGNSGKSIRRRTRELRAAPNALGALVKIRNRRPHPKSYQQTKWPPHRSPSTTRNLVLVDGFLFWIKNPKSLVMRTRLSPADCAVGTERTIDAEQTDKSNSGPVYPALHGADRTISNLGSFLVGHPGGTNQDYRLSLIGRQNP